MQQADDTSDQRILPGRVRPVVLTFAGLLLAAAIGGLLWRGQAILLDLAALSNALWCF